MSKIILQFLTVVALWCVAHQLVAQQKVTLSGYINDAENGEALIGATVFVRETQSGSASNVYGFYSITLPPGQYTIEYTYVGYQPLVKEITLNENQRLNVEMTGESQQLQEVVISGERVDANVTSTEMSTNKLDIQTIKKIPAFLGEVDVLKSIQLLPGVSTVGEGAAGFNVRGGGVGQNLILLDEAPVYNSSHLFGFFSVFNPDAVKDTKLYKGAIPAQYGGRIASLLDVRTKEGNSKRFEANGGIGTVFSRLALEAPIVKDKSSFILAGRRSYIDILAKPFLQDLDDVGLSFYDLTMKTNYNFDKNNRLYLSGYFGRDVFKFDENQGFNWGSKTASLRWNHVFNARLFSNFTAVYSKYDYQLEFGEDARDRFTWDSDVTNYMFKPEFTYFVNNYNEVSFGGSIIYYTFEPANAVGISDGERIDISLDKKYNLESAVYLSNKHELNDRLSAEYGLRYSMFQYLGPGTAYEYGEAVPGERKPVVGAREYDRWETIQSYSNLEPRVAFKYQLNASSSIKGSYNRMAQYIHLVSNTTASNPLDVWVPSSNNLEPQIGDQFALGYFRNFGEGNDYEASAEVYTRLTKNQVDYIDGADILINEYLEGELLSGEGRAYGLELYLKKNVGNLNGWISYTLGRTELQVEGINDGDWYPTRYDQTHNLKVAAFYDLNERISLSGNFTFVSGTPTTFPTSRYVVQGILIPYNAEGGRNNVRLESYHRLDLSLRLEGKKMKKGKERRNEDYWVFSLYNVYGRKNPFSIYFSQSDDRVSPGEVINTEANRVSIVGSIIPSISYNFRF
ncbi:TonB-dependent receptor [Fulvivirga kasyanovii]|uniref:TonB-dependent receptor n=1 Tax=Fulvivirga kasyanovii TaxID=396812 RepID=A0ABW9RWG9_9BACT|nr:TonB-dependent receptor [Fulvivirga kasyanovii]MTI27350.1 TonB-dependent receptor [Fulvivirga kasyanovii]